VTGAEKTNLMIKKCSYLIGLTVLVLITASAFKSYETELMFNEHYKVSENLAYHVATADEHEQQTEMVLDEVVLPMTGKSFIGFKEALAVRESAGNYKAINDYGYLGKFQFGKETLKIMGIKNTKEFLANPELQEKAFVLLLQKNKWILRKEIKKYEGKVIGGVLITESGLLAAAHLGGAGAVQKFLKTKGSESFSDGFGTNIKTYLKKFAGYDMSFVTPEKNPKVI